MSTLTSKLASWRPFSALVLGDFMLDELVYGNADRLSPEAPVPVLHVQREERRPGGAANVCLDLVALGGAVRAVGVVGADGAGAEVSRSLAAAGVQAGGLVTDPSRCTTRKRSLIGLAQHRHPQKMFREDHECRAALAGALEESVIEAVRAGLSAGSARADVVCLEDYDKGVCTPRVCREVIALCRRAGVPVLVDPAPIRDYAKYRGAAALTPNRTEAARAAGPGPGDDASAAEYGDMARRLRDELGLEAAIITLDRQGMVLAEQGAEPEVIPTVAREVYDVSGAGDMVLAALAGARANDVGWPDACRLANAAAGLEVAVFGVVPIPIERVHAEVLRRERGPGSKLRTLEELLVEAAALRREGRRLVFTNGCFDLLHAGHLALLQQAARHGDYLVVAINSDESVRRLKGPERPVRTERDRARLLGGLECVDAVVVFGDPTPERLIQALRPDVLVKGAEYALAEVPGAEFVIQSGGRVELLEMVQGVSTTGTIERIRAG